MNYLKQILAFNDLQMFESKLSTGEIALWHALMYINNKAGWADWFTSANRTLESLSGLSRSGVANARNVLKQNKFIDFKANGTKATSYHINSLTMSYSEQGTVQDTNQESGQDTVQESVQGTVQDSGTLIKHKLKQNINGLGSSATATADVYNAHAKIIPKLESEMKTRFGDMELKYIDRWEYSDEMILVALEEAVLSKALSLRYMNRVLQRFAKDGIFNQVAYLQEQRNKNKQTVSDDKPRIPIYKISEQE